MTWRQIASVAVLWAVCIRLAFVARNRQATEMCVLVCLAGLALVLLQGS
jgi:hypothetical protein